MVRSNKQNGGRTLATEPVIKLTTKKKIKSITRIPAKAKAIRIVKEKAEKKVSTMNMGNIDNAKEKTHLNTDDEVNSLIMKFDQIAELTKMFKFRTSASCSIRADVMYYAIKNLNKTKSILKLSEYVPIDVADKLQNGILEFTLIKLSTETSDVLEFIENIYRDKLHDICINLDPSNKRIGNTTLCRLLSDGDIDPHFVAFMTPPQIHPERWAKELERERNKEDAGNIKKVTDIYKCRKCGDRKSTTMQMQTRSADEPMTIFVTCLTCYNTFTTQ